MRTKIRLVILSLLALLGMALASVPAARAAPALLPSAQTTIVGTLVAAPQPTAPTMLLLQVGGQTIAVSITATTQVVDSANHALSLASLHDGDTLQVIGDPNAAGGITASVVQDLSTPVPPPPVSLTVQGTLASMPATNLLCLSKAGVLSGASPQVPVTSPCPAGQLPVYLTGTTQYLGPAGQAYTLSALRLGDLLRASGMMVYTQFTAATIQDLTTPPPPPVPLTVQGTLAATPSPGLLCLANTGFVSGAAPQWRVIGSCAAGQLPVYLTGATQYLGPAGQAYTLGMLQIGDLLRASGTMVNAQFTASTVQDFTARAVPVRFTTLTGTVQYISPFTSRPYFTMRILVGPSLLHGLLRPAQYVAVTVYVQRTTWILVHGRWTNQVTALSPGQAVTVMGVYDAHARQVSPTVWVVVR